MHEGSAEGRKIGYLDECVNYLSTIAGQLETLNHAQRYVYVTESGGDWGILYRIERATGRVWKLEQIQENWQERYEDKALPEKRWVEVIVEPEGENSRSR